MAFVHLRQELRNALPDEDDQLGIRIVKLKQVSGWFDLGSFKRWPHKGCHNII